jgi:serine O-acetyltransferase
MLALIPLVGRILRKISWWMSCAVFRSKIAIEASIGAGLYVPHPYGIVLGGCTLGRDVTVLHGVTIGQRARSEKSSPVIGDGAYLGAGAVVLGEIVIGERAVVGANSVVLADVAAGATAVGVPARIVQPKPAPAAAT